MSAPFRVTVEDLEKGTAETVNVPRHGWYLLTTGRLYCAGEVHYRNGTIVLTIKRAEEQDAKEGTP